MKTFSKNEQVVANLAQKESSKDALFELIIERYYLRLNRFILSKVSNVFDAEDLTQEVFESAYNSIDSLKDPNKLHLWLFGIANNKIKMYYRKKSRKGNVEGFNEEILYNLTDTQNLPDEEVLSDFEQSDLYSIIKATPKRIREPLELQTLEGYSYQEIANTLQIPKSTVRGRIYQTKKQFAANCLKPSTPKEVREQIAKLITKREKNLSGLREELLKDHFANITMISVLEPIKNQTYIQQVYVYESAKNVISIRIEPNIKNVNIKYKDVDALIAFLQLIPQYTRCFLAFSGTSIHYEIIKQFGEYIDTKVAYGLFLLPEWLQPHPLIEIREVEANEENLKLFRGYEYFYDSVKFLLKAFSADRIKICVTVDSTGTIMAGAIFFDHLVGRMMDLYLCENFSLTNTEFSMFLASCITRMSQKGHVISDFPDSTSRIEFLKGLGFRRLASHVGGWYTPK